MNKKLIMSLLLLTLVLFLAVGCGKKTTPIIPEEQEKQVSVAVTLDQKPTVETLNSLEEAGFKVESIKDKVVMGKVGESKVEKLKEKEEVVSVEEKNTPQNQQMGMEQIEQQIDALREKRNLTGPYYTLVTEEGYKTQDILYLCTRYRFGINDNTYFEYFKEINQSLTAKEIFNVSHSNPIGFCADVSKGGFNKLKSDSNLLEIGWRRPPGSPVVIELNGTKYWLYQNETKVKIE